jgi:pyrroloquinoline quinone biosynthesis protein E
VNERPYTLVAELTYRCPLRCVYCSNPVKLDRQDRELDTDTWRRVFREAEALGVVQLNLSGGEPLLREDLESLVEEARACQLYTNLISSGAPLDQTRLAGLVARGLDAFQLSFQDPHPEPAARIAGRDVLAPKLEVAEWVRAAGLPLTINVVLHRENIDRVDEIVAFAERLGAERLELANTQYLGWALMNRDALLPTDESLVRARVAAERAQKRLRGRMEVLFVLPDYQAGRPRACMDGWARRFIVVAPDGTMLPCHQAHTISTLQFENVGARSVADIWNDSAAFNAFRGEGWMPEPCRSCDRRAIDFGGCRCQAFALAGDAALTDPACSLSPHHGMVVAARGRAEVDVDRRLVYRRVPAAK